MAEIRFDSYSPADTIEIGKKLGAALRGGETIAYRGGLGAGKTTMTRGIALGMGLPDIVSSPTFAIVNEYCGDNLRLCHFDMYRINGADSLESTGYYDYLGKNTVIAAEWSENTEGLLDEDITVEIQQGSEEGHRIIIITSDKELDI